MRLFHASFPLLLLIFGACTPQEDVPLYGIWETNLEAMDGTDPRTEVTATFTSPSGETYRVDAFWDGGSVWKVRFMPVERGIWHWETQSEPVAVGLDDAGGSFEGVENDRATAFDVHGPIGVSDDGRYLQHADGKPFFWLGDTAWNGALKSGEEGWSRYLADRSSKHFSAIQFVSTQWRSADADAEGRAAYEEGDPLLVNPAFWQRMDDKVKAINDAGMLAVPVVLWGLGNPEEVPVPGRLPESDAVYLAKYITARYGAHHVAWFLGGDDDYSGDLGERWRRIGRAVYGGRHHAPVTLHQRGLQWHFDNFAEEDWLNFLIYQSGHGDGDQTLAWTHSGPPSRAWESPPYKPIINSEPNYEDHLAYQSRQPHSAYNIRRASYWSLLATPTAGVSYGAHGIWSWETETGVPKDHEGTGEAKPWFEAVDLSGSGDLAVAFEIFDSIDWWELRPAPEMLVAQPGEVDPAAFVSSSKTIDGSQAVIYLPLGGEIAIRMMEGLDSPVWIDPRTGAETEAALDDSRFTAPDTQDWVLIWR